MSDIVVPQLGESVVEARVARWLKKEGDRVETGEPVVELETEKIDLEVGADHGGVLASIKHKEGDDVKVGDLLAVIDESGAAKPAAGGNGAEQTTASPEGKKEAAAREEKETTARQERATAAREEKGAAARQEKAAAPREDTGGARPATAVTGRIPDGRSAALTEEPRAAAPAEEPRATPTARRIAKEHDVNLGAVQGTGSAGRVMKQDVQGAIAPGAPTKAPETAPTAKPAAPTAKPSAPTSPGRTAPRAERAEERVRMTKRRQTIARRLVEAQRTAAMLTTFNEVDMTAIMALRERRKESFKQQHGVSLGIASFFVKAAVAALRAFPQLNAEIQGDEIVYKRYYDIGMAVGAEGGLVVPVLRDADRMSFAEVELAIRDYAKRAAEGALTLEDLAGGTFTITNGGVFGSLMSTPILNPPQVGILGLHKIQDRPVAHDGQAVLRPMMYVALSYDHRIVDGREAVQFLVKIKEFIEDPGNLLLES
jgi:2-oxoglutarate dehydrogenase E2 component (dihydrolipoamide succinyltransferase)